MEQSHRNAILKLHCASHSVSTITKKLKYPRATVYRVMREFKTLGKVERNAHKTRSDKIQTPRFLAGLNRMIRANGGTSMTKLAAMREVSHRTIGRVVKEDPRYKSASECATCSRPRTRRRE